MLQGSFCTSPSASGHGLPFGEGEGSAQDLDLDRDPPTGPQGAVHLVQGDQEVQAPSTEKLKSKNCYIIFIIVFLIY